MAIPLPGVSRAAGGKWCGGDDKGSQQCIELTRKDCKEEQTCSWDRVSTECWEIYPNNECDGLPKLQMSGLCRYGTCDNHQYGTV